MKHLLCVSKVAALCALSGLLSCQSDPEENSHSGATNWLRCDEVADCSETPGATCGDEGYCLDTTGRRIESDDATTDDDTADDDAVADDDSMDDDAVADDSTDDDSVGDDATAGDDLADDDSANDDSADDDVTPDDDSTIAADDDATPVDPSPADPDASSAGAGGSGGSTGGAGPSGGAGGSETCEYDSCHPERCDQEGEPCCDPFPGDGVNYCNSGLTCQGASCILRAETTTPEVLERNACEATAGTWDYEGCGHYVCGVRGSCDLLVPGCNCGEGRNFINENLGCDADATCGALQPFECGETTCTTVGTQYCEHFMNGVGITTYSCQPIPEPCLDTPTCECMLEQFGETVPPTMCYVGESNELVVFPPGGP